MDSSNYKGGKIYFSWNWLATSPQTLQFDNFILLLHRSKYFERKILIIFLLINLNMCFSFSKEPSNRDASFEYPQHMF